MVSAVYQIRNTISGRVYVGSAADVDRRWRDHRYLLRRGQHHSVKLQRSWNRHNEEAFEFLILEEANIANLLPREQFWIGEMNACCPRRGLNILPTAGSHLGAKRSAAARARMSAAAKGKKKSPWSQARRDALSLSQQGKIIPPDVIAKMRATRNSKPRKPHSIETRLKISEKAKQRGLPPGLLEAAWAASRGRVQSPEERAMRSAAALKWRRDQRER